MFLALLLELEVAETEEERRVCTRAFGCQSGGWGGGQNGQADR